MVVHTDGDDDNNESVAILAAQYHGEIWDVVKAHSEKKKKLEPNQTLKCDQR